MEIGVIGKPNVGKSTTFNALTLLDVPMAPYPFTTIDAEPRGRGGPGACPHAEKGDSLHPGNAKCVDGTRWVPVNLVDVPGLVPGAHEGKGLGHKFLDDLRAPSGFLHVVDASGAHHPGGGSSAPGYLRPVRGGPMARSASWSPGSREILSRDFLKNVRSPSSSRAGRSRSSSRDGSPGLSISPGAIVERRSARRSRRPASPVHVDRPRPRGAGAGAAEGL